MSKIYYIRHGESVMNRDCSHLVGGRSNESPLTENGVRQASTAGRWLLRHNVQPDLVVVSPAKRTLQTASNLMRAADILSSPLVDDRIQELSQGHSEGMLRTEVWTKAEVARLRVDPMNHSLQGGESFSIVQQRMRGHLDELTRENTRTILVVSHGLAIRALAGQIDGSSHGEIVFGLKTPNCSLTKIGYEPDSDLSVEVVGRDIVAEQMAFEA